MAGAGGDATNAARDPVSCVGRVASSRHANVKMRCCLAILEAAERRTGIGFWWGDGKAAGVGSRP